MILTKISHTGPHIKGKKIPFLGANRQAGLEDLFLKERIFSFLLCATTMLAFYSCVVQTCLPNDDNYTQTVKLLYTFIHSEWPKLQGTKIPLVRS